MSERNGLKPHIVFLAAWYPHDRDPMFGLFVHRHAALMTSDFNVSVLHVTYDREKANGLFVSEQDNVFITNLNIRTRSKVLRWLYFFIGGLKAYRFICRRQGRPVLNHVHVLTRMGVLAAWIKCRRGIPFVVTEHWSRYFPENPTFRGPIRKLATRYVCRKAAVVSAVSEYLAHRMQQKGLKSKKEYFIIRNVVDENVFRLNRGSSGAIRRFVNISCFEDKSKNISGIIDAIDVLRKKRQDFECILVGTGMDYDRMFDYSKQKGLSDFIKFPGLQTKEEVATMLMNADFYLQNSNYETSSVVIAEAQCCGLPVVSTDVAAIPEIVNAENGILTKPGDSELLCRAIDLMLDSFTDFDKNKIRKDAVSLFSGEAVRKQLANLYQSALNS